MRAVLVSGFCLIALSMTTVFGESRTVESGTCYFYDKVIVQVVLVEEDAVVWEYHKPLKIRNTFNLWSTKKVEFLRTATRTECGTNKESNE